MSDPLIFDRRRVRLHRDRAAGLQRPDSLLAELASRMEERLGEMNRHFPVALQLGAQSHAHVQRLAMAGGIGMLVQADLSEAMMKIITSPWKEEDTGGGQVSTNSIDTVLRKADPHPDLPPSRGKGSYNVAADEELLPFADASFDLCMDFATLHWINDFPGALIQIRRALKPGGLLLAMLPGGQTLKELRQSFERAEMEAGGGISPRVSPFVDVRDAGGLLSRAGFSHPVIDSELLTVQYDHPLKLLKDLRALGETNALIHSRKHFTPCSWMMLMADHYLRNFSTPEGRVKATFELVMLTAWKEGR